MSSGQSDYDSSARGLWLGFRLGKIFADQPTCPAPPKDKTHQPNRGSLTPRCRGARVLRPKPWVTPVTVACAKCHAAIARSYSLTPMAHASGPAIENVVPADFVPSQLRACTTAFIPEAGHVCLSFDRPGDPGVRGKRELLYYIGSGRRGLSYLFARDGFLFESPVNWYSHERRWDTAPAYQNAREIPLTLPAFTSCLRCHVSGMRAPAKGTDNLYPAARIPP